MSQADAIVGKVWYIKPADYPGIDASRYTDYMGLIFYQSQCGEYWGGMVDKPAYRKTVAIGALCESTRGGGALPINEYHRDTTWNILRELARTNSLNTPDLMYKSPEPPPTPAEIRAKRFNLITRDM